MKTFLEKILGHDTFRSLTQSMNAFKRLVRPKHEDEVYFLPKIIGKGETVLEIGANYGQYARVMSKLVGANGQVHAFEPAQITYRNLVRNCKILGLKNVRPHRLALSDQPGVLNLFTPIKRDSTYGVAAASLTASPDKASAAETVSVDTLDNFCRANHSDKVHFIRCDVEGAEYSMLMGGIETIEGSRPSLLMEVHESEMKRFGHTFDMLMAFFETRNYACYKLNGNRLNEVTQLTDCTNFFWIPKEKATPPIVG